MRLLVSKFLEVHIDAAGNVSDVVKYEVTNIDKVAPASPVATASKTTATNGKVTVTATFSEDTATRQYSLDNQTWKTYSKGVAFMENGTVWFRGIDAAGNVSEAASCEVTNILRFTEVDASLAPADGVVAGGTGDELFRLTPDGTWGTYHVARWNGGADVQASLAGMKRYRNALAGGGGYDAVQLAAGDNALLYSDLLTPSGGGVDPAARLAGISEIRGNDGRDIVDMTDAQGGYPGGLLLKGGAGDDALWAGSGDDILVGGLGDDDLRGGSGDDIYLFGTDWGRDSITDTGGTLVFDSSLEGKLSIAATNAGTSITDGLGNSVELSWAVSPTDHLHFADLESWSGYRREAILSQLA